MNTMPMLSMSASTQIELAWQMGSASLAANGNQILVNSSVYKLIGSDGIEQLKFRLSSQLGGAAVIAHFDQAHDVVRLMEQSQLDHSPAGALSGQNLLAGTQAQSQAPVNLKCPQQLRAFGKKSKIPRPPNAFIIYRAQFHPHMKQHNPEMHNNEISKALGKRWKNEPDDIKEKYKNMAIEVKARHAAEYPDYQYAPRKAGEKKRRMTARKLERLRESRDFQETSSFPSPDAAITAGLDAQAGPESPTEPITYQQNDTFTSILPTSFDNIGDEIARECGVYGQDYTDVAGDMDDLTSTPQNHLLQASPASHATGLQNSWESMIGWHALNSAATGAEDMAVDLEDISAAQASGPDSQHKPYDDASIQFP